MLVRVVLGIITISTFACTAAQSQEPDNRGLPAAPAARIVNYVPSEHRFWDRKNILLFSGVAVFRGLDYASTKNFERRGRQEVLIPDDIVNNSAGFAGLEAAGAATSIGVSYIFHRTGHHTMERWLSIGHIGVTAFGVAWNYSLKTTRPK
jgi:phosphatidylserine synthase